MNWAQERIVVTGASRGIGSALVSELTARGASVVAVARSAGALDALAERSGCLPLVADLAQPGAAGSLLAEAGDLLGGSPSMLVCNAAEGAMGALAALDDKTIEHAVALNLVGPMQMTRALFDGRSDARVVLVSSLSAVAAPPDSILYGTTKTALSRFHDLLLGELPPGSSLLVELGPVQTDLLDRFNTGRGAPALAFLSRVGITPTMSAAAVARRAADAIARRRSYLTLPRRATPASFGRRAAQRGLTTAIDRFSGRT